MHKRGKVNRSNPGSELNTIDNELNALNIFIGNFMEKHKIPFHEVLDLLGRAREKQDVKLIPSCILRERKLGILESVTKYLKEEFSLSYHEIALLLKKDDRVVWVTHNNAVKKKKERFAVKGPNAWIPVSIFASKLGPMEAITIYLKDHVRLSFNDIAKLLNRDNRTIWACYHKGNRKKDV